MRTPGLRYRRFLSATFKPKVLSMMREITKKPTTRMMAFSCQKVIHRHTSFYCAFISCPSQILWGFFCCCLFLNKLEVCGNPASSKFIGAILPTAFACSCLWVTFWKFLQYFKLYHCYSIQCDNLGSVVMICGELRGGLAFFGKRSFFI